jgi:hypothetical protein
MHLTSTIAESQKNIDKNYREKLEQMFYDDQAVRQERQGRQAINNVDSVHYIEFKRMVSQYGFPTENLIGVKCTETNNGIQPSPYDLPLMHFSQRRYKNVDSLLDAALKENSIQPHWYAYFTAHLGKPINYYISPIVVMNGEYYTYHLNDSLLAEVNKHRRKIGLSSIDNQIRKIKYRLNNPQSQFRLFGPIEYFPNLPKLIQDSILVSINID